MVPGVFKIVIPFFAARPDLGRICISYFFGIAIAIPVGIIAIPFGLIIIFFSCKPQHPFQMIQEFCRQGV